MNAPLGPWSPRQCVRPAAKDFGFHGQPYALFVGRPKPLSFELLLEYTVLFDEIIDHRLLVAVKPTG
jgi:hypothetical protein